jgi:medium-chain acyl-[acyl-carrier-protein] hydrolase
MTCLKSDFAAADATTVGDWFHVAMSRRRSLRRLFCLPPAGGGAVNFDAWRSRVSSFVELWAVEPPGRGRRLQVPCHRRMQDLARELADAMEPHLDRPYSMFGHSLGGLVAFETVRALRRRGAPQPDHLFVAAIHSPDRGPYRRGIHTLPRDLLVRELTHMGGTPNAVLEDEDLLDLVLPCVRADFELYESYSYLPEAPINCPITAFRGTNDASIRMSDMAAWAIQTLRPFRLETVEGDHFFPRDLDFVRRLASEISASSDPPQTSAPTGPREDVAGRARGAG